MIAPSALRQVPFPPYLEFQSRRVFPLVAKVAFVGCAFVVASIVNDWVLLGSGALFLPLLATRLATLGFGLAGGLVAWFGRRPIATLVGVVVFGALSQNTVTLAQVFLLRDLSSVPYLLCFYFLSFLLLGPLLSRAVTVGFLVLVVASQLATFELARAVGVAAADQSDPLLLKFLVPLLTFIGLMMESLRASGREAYLHARRDHYHMNLDGLSQLLNRPSWTDRAGRQTRRSAESGAPVGLIMADIDHFKAVNDALGHDAGDRVIQAVALTLLAQTRDTDLVGRLGGEEFAVLLPGADPGTAAEVAERIRLAVADLPPVEGRTVTVSLGVVEVAPGEPLAEALKRADGCLYEAKRSGRNRVVAPPCPDRPLV